MKIISVDFKNILGIKEFKLDAGQITIISGKNAEGKTSVLSAIQNAIGGGSIKEIKNVNAEDEEARIVLVMRDENGTSYVLDKDEKSLRLKQQVGDTAGFKSVPKPQSFLNMLRDCKLNNPIKFLNCNDKERVQLILEAIDLPFDSSEMWDAIGVEKENFEAIPVGMHPLNEISYVRKLIFDERTGINRTEKSKRLSCDELRLSVPAEIPTVDGIEQKEAELEEYKLKRQKLSDEAESRYQKRLADSQNTLAAVKSQLEHDLDNLIAFENIELEKAISHLKSESAKRIEAARASARFAFDTANDKKECADEAALTMNKDEMKVVNLLNPEIEKLTESVATLRQQEKDIVRIETIHDQANKMEVEADELKQDSISLSDALKSLDSYKASLSENLPIQGLDLADNKVTINGIPWEQLNTAQKIISAVKIIAERSKKHQFKFCLIDGVESLDRESQNILEQTLLSHDIQAVLGRVTDDEMRIEK